MSYWQLLPDAGWGPGFAEQDGPPVSLRVNDALRWGGRGALEFTTDAVICRGPFSKLLMIYSKLFLTLGSQQKGIFGETWDFVPTGLNPPSPNVGTPTTQKKILMFILHFRLF